MALVDIGKKIDKARSKLGIADDEQILMGCTANPRGTIGAAALGGVAGAAIRAKVDKRAAEAADGGMAASWPGGRTMLAITSQRLLLCKMGAMSGKPTEVAAAWPHSDIAGIEVEKGKTAYPFTVVFHDGSEAQGEGAKGSGADQLGEVAATVWSDQ